MIIERTSRVNVSGFSESGYIGNKPWFQGNINWVKVGILPVSILAYTISVSGLVMAQTEESARSGRALEEIVVSARKRDEGLFDVPVAVSAMGAEFLERYSLNNLESVTEMMPGIALEKPAGASGGGIRIRGLGTGGNDVGFEQSVLVGIDGMQVSRGRALFQSYFDLQQIEVMKGPQSLFFGKNSPAGVISMTSKGPTDSFESYVRTGYEFRADERYIEGAVSGPLTEAIGARLALRSRKMKGWMENKAQPVENPVPGAPDLPGATDSRLGEEETALRLTLTYDDGGPFDAELKLLGVDYEDDGGVMRMEKVHCASEPPPLRRVLGGVTPDPRNNCKPDWNIYSSAIPGEVAEGYISGSDGDFFTDQESVISSLTMNYEFDKMNISVTITWIARL